MLWPIVLIVVLFGLAKMISDAAKHSYGSKAETDEEIAIIERGAKSEARAAELRENRLAAQSSGSAAVDQRTRAARRAKMARSEPAPDATSYEIKRNAEGKEFVPRAEWIAGIDRPDIPEYGTWARFEYVDADGVITKRSIRQWAKHGAYIEGFCMDRREGRTFRQDRIGDWRCG